MATRDAAGGIDHLTVVPENFETVESGDGDDTDGTAAEADDPDGTAAGAGAGTDDPDGTAAGAGAGTDDPDGE